MHKILLVDDDRELTSLLKELLEMEGFNVVIAYDGEQALQQLDSSIDLLLLDVMMPKKNGIETLKELRQIHQTPVIMLTARGSELDKVLGLDSHRILSYAPSLHQIVEHRKGTPYYSNGNRYTPLHRRQQSHLRVYASRHLGIL